MLGLIPVFRDWKGPECLVPLSLAEQNDCNATLDSSSLLQDVLCALCSALTEYYILCTYIHIHIHIYIYIHAYYLYIYTYNNNSNSNNNNNHMIIITIIIISIVMYYLFISYYYLIYLNYLLCIVIMF